MSTGQYLTSTALILTIVAMTSCGKGDSVKLYSSQKFSVYGNRVEQGIFKSEALNDSMLVSDYQSPANSFFNPLISYKFSINGRDNEAPSGQDHQALLRQTDNGPVVIRSVFGEKDAANKAPETNISLPANTHVRFEVDMRSVVSAFDNDGYYTDFNGEKIYKSDFKGVWIAGGTVPLSWDFENLPGRDDLRLTDPDGDGIFTCELAFNVFDPSKHTSSERKVTSDLSHYPSLRSPFALMNAMYRLSLQEMMQDIRPDSTFMAGKQWGGVWTRDISYSITLALAAVEPEIARKSLLYKVRNGKIIQDTGTGGSWPVSTDRQVWALAAWEVYKSTGDTEWLKQAYEIIKSSVDDDLKVAFNPATALFYGESSFLDWRKQTYPLWMEPIDIYMSHNLGTNAVFFETLSILGKMGQTLGIENEYGQRAEELKSAINSRLWSEEKGYYGQYLYGHYNYTLSPRSESLGEALCILFGVADKERTRQLFSSVPVMEYGMPCIYPQIPGIPPYHNNAIWPFVQAYWTWAGARAGNTPVVEHGIASVYRQAALFLTNKENMVAGTGDFNGTEINSDYQLWSVAANLSIVYRIIFGIDYQADAISFSPFIPESYSGRYELKGLKYRNSLLDITVENYGNAVSSFEIDGREIEGNSFPASMTGHHTVKITMNGKTEPGTIKFSASCFSPATPEPVMVKNHVEWTPVGEAVKYAVYCNGKRIAETDKTIFDLSADMPGEYQIMSVDRNKVESFLSKPLQYEIYEGDTTEEAETFAKQSAAKISGFSGKGFVELKKESPVFIFTINAPSDGVYVVEFCYSNGNGPVNTDNKCAQRSLYADGKYYGTAVFPQRGRDEWSDWGFSNPVNVVLKKGLNKLELRFEDYNNNMNVEENSFMLDYIRCIRSEKVMKR